MPTEPPTTAPVWRYDLARFSPNTQRTPQGFLKAPAFFTRAGIFEYTRADGSKVRELRPDEEVFHQDSMKTAQSAPLTLDHPKEGMVTPQNATKLSKGFSGETVEKKDTLLAGSITIMDSEVIEGVHRGDLKDISMGYTCSIERTAGEHPTYGRYDQIQRNIRYNHIALGGKNWGRAGDAVGIRLDSEDAVQRSDSFTQLERYILQQLDLQGMDREDLAKKAGFDPVWVLEDILFGFITPKRAQLQKIASVLGLDVETLITLVPRVDRADSQRRYIMEEQTITIGGVEFKVPKNAAQAFEAEVARKDSIISQLKTEKEQLQGRFDAQGEELKKSQDKIKELDDPKRFDSAVSDRIELLGQARQVLGEDATISGSKREVMEQVLKHDNADLDLSEKSEDYVQARFDQMMENLPAIREDAARRSQATTRTAAHVAAVTPPKPDERFDSEAARQRMVDENQNAWKNGNVKRD